MLIRLVIIFIPSKCIGGKKKMSTIVPQNRFTSPAKETQQETRPQTEKQRRTRWSRKRKHSSGQPQLQHPPNVPDGQHKQISQVQIFAARSSSLLRRAHQILHNSPLSLSELMKAKRGLKHEDKMTHSFNLSRTMLLVSTPRETGSKQHFLLIYPESQF